MNNLKIFCICINNDLIDVVKKLNYIPVGLGSDNFSTKWTTDNTQNNISFKNRYYGEHTFHYWYWKNKLNYKIEDDWIGFCGYRRLWAKENYQLFNNLNPKKNFLNYLPEKCYLPIFDHFSPTYMM